MHSSTASKKARKNKTPNGFRNPTKHKRFKQRNKPKSNRN